MGNSTNLANLTSGRESRRLGTRQTTDQPGIMATLPKREFITVEPAKVTPPMMQTATFQVSYVRVLKRLVIWLAVGISVAAGNLLDWIRGKNSEVRRVERLRETLEKSGGTLVKIGQLLAIRIDLIPWVYCVELLKLVDQLAPFPVEEAIQAIEKATGKSLVAVFTKFDPEPILSTSVACTFQGYLANGKKVAVKVRRPNAGEIFLADLKALDWILDTLEFLSILRPGYTHNLRREFRETIQGEFNFLLEARHQSLFRREAKKSGKKFFNAPRVYFEYCSQDVIVQEFASGMWLWELLAAVEQNDHDALARAESLNIDPKLVAKRLLWVNFWSLDEHLLFKVDLHPDNVIIRKDSKLTFIDFNSVGVLNQEKRQAIQQTMYYAWKRDPLEMARESMVLLEPLPPIDIIKFTKDLEASFWQCLYALESRHIEWWERTSIRLWLGFVRVAREHNVTLSIDVLCMIRSRLLHDTIGARLCPKIDHVKEYHKFAKYRAKAARDRVDNRIRRQVRQGLDGRIYLQVEELADTGERLFRQFQRFLSIPALKFNAVLGKSVYSLSVLFRLLGQFALTTVIAIGILISIEWAMSRQLVSFTDAFTRVLSSRIYQLIILLLMVINSRVMLFRLSDKEV